MGISIIPNQPLKLLGINETAHNDLSESCNCLGQKYYQPVTCDDESSVQVGLTEADGIELLLDNSFDDPIASGTTDGTSGDDIVDSAATFITDGILDEMLATNDTDTTFSFVDANPAVETTATVTALTGGFITAEDYSIYRWRRKVGGAFGAWTATEYLKIDNGLLTKVGTANDVGVFQEFDLQTSVYYKITFTIQNMVRTTTAAGVKVFIGGTEAIFVNSEGTKTFYYFAETPTDNEIVIQGVDASWDMTDISVKAMTKINIGAREEGATDFTFIETSNDNIKYRQIDTDDDGVSEQNTPVANAKFEWTNVKSGYTCIEGCYQLCILDLPSIEHVTNGQFIGSSNWVVGPPSKWSFVDSVARGDATPLPSTVDQRELTQILITPLPGGGKFDLTFDILNFVSGTISAKIGAISLGSFSSNGTHTAEIDLTGASSEDTLIFTLSSSTGRLDIDNVSILEKAETVTILNCSEPFILKSEHTCSRLLKWTNVNNAFGINYNLFTLVHSLRVIAKKWQPIYEKVDKRTDTDSTGTVESIYSRTVKKERLTLRELPEYIHDAISIGVEHDSFTVDDIVFISEDEEYAPIWRKSSLLAPVDMELIESGQLLEKRRCQ